MECRENGLYLPLESSSSESVLNRACLAELIFTCVFLGISTGGILFKAKGYLVCRLKQGWLLTKSLNFLATHAICSRVGVKIFKNVKISEPEVNGDLKSSRFTGQQSGRMGDQPIYGQQVERATGSSQFKFWGDSIFSSFN